MDPFIKDYTDNTLLHFACQSRNLELIAFLVEEKQLDVRACNSTFFTPLHYAVMMHEIPIISYLINQGADNLAMNKFGNTPYEMATNISETKALLSQDTNYITYNEETNSLENQPNLNNENSGVFDSTITLECTQSGHIKPIGNIASYYEA